MAQGHELILAPSLENLQRLAGRLGLGWRDPRQEENGWTWSDEIGEPIARAIEGQLAQAHIELLRERIDEKAARSAEAGARDKVIARVQGRPREFSGFALSIHCTEDDLDGEGWWNYATFGISLLGRYFPIFLDKDHDHGGSDRPIRFEQELLDGVRAAQEKLVAHIPELAGSVPVVQPTFY